MLPGDISQARVMGQADGEAHEDFGRPLAAMNASTVAVRFPSQKAEDRARPLPPYPPSSDRRSLRQLIHYLLGCSIGQINDLVYLTLGYNKRWSETKNVAVRHCSCDKSMITGCF